MNNFEKGKHLLSEAETLSIKLSEQEKEKEPEFNLLSVLGIETKEDLLHSRFIRELLDTKGAHNHKYEFLNLFMKQLKQVVGERLPEEIFSAEDYTEAHREFAIDNSSKDDSDGRMDIFLKSVSKDRTICIENKIYAIDQFKQVLRYRNFDIRNENHLVFYLTLTGTEPHERSYRDEDKKLVPGKDFYLLSYEHHIIPWLEECKGEVESGSELEFSIRQYLRTLKRLTNTMSEEKKEVRDLIMNNYKEAEFIARHFDGIMDRIRLNFKRDLANHLKSELPALCNSLGLGEVRFKVTNFDDVSNNMAPLWIEGEGNPNLIFGIEPFNPNSNAHLEGSMFIGVFPRHFTDEEYDFPFPCDSDKAPYWLATERLYFEKDGEKKEMNLRNEDVVNVIQNLDSDEYREFRSKLVRDIISYIEESLKAVEGSKEFFLPDLKATL